MGCNWDISIILFNDALNWAHNAPITSNAFSISITGIIWYSTMLQTFSEKVLFPLSFTVDILYSADISQNLAWSCCAMLLFPLHYGSLEICNSYCSLTIPEWNLLHEQNSLSSSHSWLPVFWPASTVIVIVHIFNYILPSSLLLSFLFLLLLLLFYFCVLCVHRVCHGFLSFIASLSSTCNNYIFI